ncbi:hypothetical protein C8R46DRAFT_1354058 [Mycena filopes]|nr:hypothetical protein C8R46DRAFT_1354058 [Mycena filopes]
MVSPRIPPELTDYIIDLLWDSKSTLHSCSLVCTSWLPSTRHHLFESIVIRPDPKFLVLLLSPSNIIGIYTKTLDFRCWPMLVAPSVSQNNILSRLPDAVCLRAIIFGSFPPSPTDLPTLPLVTSLSFQHSKFASAADLSDLLAKFTALASLELCWASWPADAQPDDDVCPHLGLALSHLSIQGIQYNSSFLTWLECPAHAPHTTGLALYIPNNAAPPFLSTLAKFLHHLNGELRHLRLDLYPSLCLQSTLALLPLGSLTGLRRLRIGHGMYFHPPSTPCAHGSCRIFPVILTIPRLFFLPRNALEELIFDVDISPGAFHDADPCWSALSCAELDQVPIVRFNVLRNRTVLKRSFFGQFCAFVRQRVDLGRVVVCSDDSG